MTQIRARDNIPVLGWLLLRGRCRDCGAPISKRYPLVEAGTALLCVLVVLVKGIEPEALLRHRVRAAARADHADRPRPRDHPQQADAFGAVARHRPWSVFFTDDLVEHIVAAALAGGFLLIAAVVYPAGMGMGDVKLAFVMGIFLGRAVAPAMFVAFFTGSIVGIAIMARYGAEARKRTIPFGPWLAFGGVVGAAGRRRDRRLVPRHVQLVAPEVGAVGGVLAPAASSGLPGMPIDAVTPPFTFRVTTSPVQLSQRHESRQPAPIRPARRAQGVRRHHRAPGCAARPGAFIVLGALAFGVLALAGYVLTTNTIKDRQAQISQLAAASAGGRAARRRAASRTRSSTSSPRAASPRSRTWRASASTGSRRCATSRAPAAGRDDQVAERHPRRRDRDAGGEPRRRPRPPRRRST